MSAMLAETPVAPAPATAAGRRITPVIVPGIVVRALVIGVVAMLVLFPFVVAAMGTPSGFVFRGTLKPSGDESQYLAAVRMGLQGDWLWHDPYMAQPPPPILMYPVYMWAGHLAGLFGLDSRGGFTLVHMMAALVLCFALWRLAAEALPGPDRPWLPAFGLGVGGLYWLVALLAAVGCAPITLSRMGSQGLSGFTALLMEAHEALGVAGQVLAFAGLLGALRRQGWARLPYLLGGSVGMALIGLAMPVLLPLTLMVTTLYTCWWLWRGPRTAPMRRALPSALLCLAVIDGPGVLLAIYYARLFGSGPWAAGQFRTVPSIPSVEQVLLWGILLPFGLWGWHRAAPAARPAATALALWACCALICSQLPFWQGIRLTAGMAVAFGALFALGLLSTTSSRLVRGRWLVALAFGPICQYLFLLTALGGGNSPYLYGNAVEDSAARWLAGHAAPGDVVLAPFGFSNVLPTIAPVRVVAGHTYQTLDLSPRLTEIGTFYGSGQNTAARQQALRVAGATLVVYDRLDAENGPFDPRGLPGLRTLFANGEVSVYRVEGAR